MVSWVRQQLLTIRNSLVTFRILGSFFCDIGEKGLQKEQGILQKLDIQTLNIQNELQSPDLLRFTVE